MVKMLSYTLFFLHLCILGWAQKPCPVNLDGNILKTMQPDPTLYYGKLFACNGGILQVEKGYKNMPYFLLALDNGGTLWVSGQVESGFEKSGNRVRVLGYFEKAASGYKPPKVNKDPYHLIAFVIMNTSTQEMAMRPGQEDIVQQWLDGKISEAGKRRWDD